MRAAATSNQWASRYPLYQVDFSVVGAGKTLTATKRRLQWRFGFVNVQALNEGRTGLAARGEEHELTLVWSLSSGKRQLLMDGKEIHFSVKRNMHIDLSFNWKGDYIMKVIAHAAKPMQQQGRTFTRQYDLSINGQSFFDMPRLYQLGMHIPESHPQQQAPYCLQQDEEQKFAVVPMHSNNERQYNNYGHEIDRNIHRPYNEYSSSGQSYNASNVSEDLLSATIPTQAANPATVSASSTQFKDPFAPQQHEVKSSLGDISNQLMSIYKSNERAPGTPPSQNFSQNQAQGVISPLTYDSGGSDGENNGRQFIHTNNGVEPKKLDLHVNNKLAVEDEVTNGMKNLVNLDDINSPVEGDFRLTMDDATAHMKKKPISKKSPKVEFVGPKPTLSQMKSSRPQSNKVSTMRTPDYVNTSSSQGGALVVYGNGAPPLGRSFGFGVGAQMQNGGYASHSNYHNMDVPVGGSRYSY